jgi:adenylate kinase family enzyme
VLKFQVREDELLTRLKPALAPTTRCGHPTSVQRVSRQTAPLMRYYHKEFITIDGVGAIDGVVTRVLRALWR